MANDLPRSARELHFTGAVKAFAPERPANALGQERPKSPPPPPPSRSVPPPAKSVRAGDVYIVEAQPTPYVGGRPSERLEAADKLVITPASKKLTTMRGPLASLDEEEILTQALDRDEIDAALFPVAKRENASAPAPNLPVPHFRSAAEAKQHHAEPTIRVPRQTNTGSLPLGVWLFAALIAGIISYQLAPQAVASLSEAVRALDSR